MFLNSGILRGLPFHCPRVALSLRFLEKRCIFYPSGPFPNVIDKPRPDHPPPSVPHVSPQVQKDIINRAFVDNFSDLISPSDTGRNRSSAPLSDASAAWPNMVQRKAPGPYDGRTVQIRYDHSITAAWNRLNAILKTNNIRRELRLTARHEQKGEKRRRIRRERWRRRFAHEVRMKVRSVIEMRNRDRLWGAKH